MSEVGKFMQLHIKADRGWHLARFITGDWTVRFSGSPYNLHHQGRPSSLVEDARIETVE